MNREIIFRAWVENEDGNMHFIYPTRIDFQSSVYYVYDSEIDYTHQIEKDKLQQFTGLKDRNGKDIYEGDLVAAVAKSDHASQSGILLVIFGYDLQWQITDNKDKDFGLPLTWGGWVSLEVIGNIYENPDLLTPKN